MMMEVAIEELESGLPILLWVVAVMRQERYEWRDSAPLRLEG